MGLLEEFDAFQFETVECESETHNEHNIHYEPIVVIKCNETHIRDN